MRLYLFTDQYPYGPGEESFLGPELEKLAAAFDITIVSQFEIPRGENDEVMFVLPNGISSMHIQPPSFIRLAFHALKAPFSKLYREEFRSVCKDGFSPIKVLHAAFEFSRADCFRRECELQGVFEDCQNALYYTFWFNNECLALVFEKTMRPDIRIVSRIHGYDLYEERSISKSQPFQKTMRDSVERIAFLSSNAMDYFTDAFGQARFGGQYVQSGLGVPDLGKQPLCSSRDGFRIVSCSNTIPLKRVHLIAKALDVLGDKSIQWVHFGDGECQEDVKRYCEEHGVVARFAGRIPHDEVIQYYRDYYVDVFITVSETEGVPVSIEEALSFGIPIIATSVGGIPEQIDGNGILLSQNPTAEEVAEAISFLRDCSADDILAMREKSRQIWKDKYDSNRLRSEFVQLLQTVARADLQ